MAPACLCQTQVTEGPGVRAAQGQISRCHTHSGSGATQCAVGSDCPEPGRTAPRWPASGGVTLSVPAPVPSNLDNRATPLLPCPIPISPWEGQPRRCSPIRQPCNLTVSPANPAQGHRQLLNQLQWRRWPLSHPRRAPIGPGYPAPYANSLSLSQWPVE